MDSDCVPGQGRVSNEGAPTNGMLELRRRPVDSTAVLEKGTFDTTVDAGPVERCSADGGTATRPSAPDAGIGLAVAAAPALDAFVAPPLADGAGSAHGMPKDPPVGSDGRQVEPTVCIEYRLSADGWCASGGCELWSGRPAPLLRRSFKLHVRIATTEPRRPEGTGILCALSSMANLARAGVDRMTSLDSTSRAVDSAACLRRGGGSEGRCVCMCVTRDVIRVRTCKRTVILVVLKGRMGRSHGTIPDSVSHGTYQSASESGLNVQGADLTSIWAADARWHCNVPSHTAS